MDVKQKELIFLGASVSAHCFPCFDYHLEQARKLGIAESEIQEAVRAGFMVMNGAGQKMSEKIKAVLTGILLQDNDSCTDIQSKKNTRLTPMIHL